MSSFCRRMSQCVKCEFSHSRADEMVQHFLKEHLKPSEVPFVCDQCQFRAHIRWGMVDHRRCEHQAPQGGDIDICYGTLKPSEKKTSSTCCQCCTYQKQRVERSICLWRAVDPETMIGCPRGGSTADTDRSRSREHQPKCSCPMREPSLKRRKDSPPVPPEGG